VTCSSITIPANLVVYLRRGVKGELTLVNEELSYALAGEVDEQAYQLAVSDFDAVRALFDAIGATDRPATTDLELCLGAWGRISLRALEAQHAGEVARLEDARVDRIELPERNVPELGQLVVTLRQRLDRSPSDTGTPRQQFRRRRRRRRGGEL
jgi:hypothetical protein